MEKGKLGYCFSIPTIINMKNLAQSHRISTNGMVVKETGLLVLLRRDWYFYYYLNKGLKTFWKTMAYMCMTMTIHVYACIFCGL
jgi:hypothetical protein